MKKPGSQFDFMRTHEAYATGSHDVEMAAVNADTGDTEAHISLHRVRPTPYRYANRGASPGAFLGIDGVSVGADNPSTSQSRQIHGQQVLFRGGDETAPFIGSLYAQSEHRTATVPALLGMAENFSQEEGWGSVNPSNSLSVHSANLATKLTGTEHERTNDEGAFEDLDDPSEYRMGELDIGVDTLDMNAETIEPEEVTAGIATTRRMVRNQITRPRRAERARNKEAARYTQQEMF